MKKIKLDKKTIEISKLPIGRYSEILKIIQKILPQVSNLTTISNDSFVAMIPVLIADNLPEAIKFIQIGTGLPEEEVEALGLSEVIDIIVAIIEENRYSEVFDKLKKLTARLQTPTIEKTVTG